MISKQAKQIEKEIKEFEEEINIIKKFKSGQQGQERLALINELSLKTNKLKQKQDRYEEEYKRRVEEFKQIKSGIYNLYLVLECNKDPKSHNQIAVESGITESNVKLYFADIEKKIKIIMRYFEMEKMASEDGEVKRINLKDKLNPKQVSDNMKIAFSAMGK